MLLRFTTTMVVFLFSACTTIHKTDVVRAPLVTLDHKYFAVHYDARLKLAKFVTYTMTAEQLRLHRAKRHDRFRKDPALIDGYGPEAYAHSGYDRGHLAPAADFSFDQAANDETFVMSNMAPQRPNLNRRAWKELEAQVRRWACGEEKVTVITGPILSDKPEYLASGIPVPERFFKIVIDQTPPRKVLAFLYKQTDRDETPAERTVPVGTIEELIQQNFDEIPRETEVRAPAQTSPWKEDDC